MKVIFLDIDGVLNWPGTSDRIDGYIGFCPDRIARFNKIIEAHPDAKIVVSSTWRHAYGRGMQDLVPLLQARGLKGDIIDQTPVKFSHVGRGGEIRMWIDSWAEKEFVDHDGAPMKLVYVILDDDTEGMKGWTETFPDGDSIEHSIDLRPYHVITHWDGDRTRPGEEGGLQDRHIEDAIKILDGGKLVPGPEKASRWVTVTAETMIQNRIRELISEQLGLGPGLLKDEDEIYDVGMDDLDMVELMMAVEEEFEVEVPEELVTHGNATVAQLLAQYTKLIQEQERL